MTNAILRPTGLLVGLRCPGCNAVPVLWTVLVPVKVLVPLTALVLVKVLVDLVGTYLNATPDSDH